MPQEIYNEGRVVGYSAWEIFKNHEEGSGVPEEEIPSESEWMTSMIGSGASMILKIPSGTTAGVHDFELPEDSKLSAAGVIFATPFIGTCIWTDTTPYWAKRVVRYGDLIINAGPSGQSLSPSSDGTSVPYLGSGSPSGWQGMVSDFVKITDGIVFTYKAKWAAIGSPSGNPYKDIIDPNFNESTAVVRLYISSALSNDVYILFTGFANKRILQGFSQWASDEGDHTENGSTDMNKNDWSSGGMLGPEVIPWASKIIFSVPNLASASSSLHRLIPSDATYTAEKIANAYTFQNIDYTVNSTPLIDFDSIKLTEYYDEHTFTGDVTLETQVSGVGKDINYLVAWYPGMTAEEINATKALHDDYRKKIRFFPPALYGQHISANGAKTLVPLDVAAPGTVKFFSEWDEAYRYRELLPDNYAAYYNSGTGTYTFVNPDQEDPNRWSNTVTALFDADWDENHNPVVRMDVGVTQVDVLSFVGYGGTPYDTSGSGSTMILGPGEGTSGLNLTWDYLKDALKDGSGIDVLGFWLRKIGTELSDNSSASDPYTQHKHTLGLIDNYNIDYTATRWFILNPGTKSQNWVKSDSVWIGSKFDSTDNNRYVTFNSGETPASLNLGTDFIKFNNGLKLFVSSTAPDPSVVGAIPNNSIGLGW